MCAVTRLRICCICYSGVFVYSTAVLRIAGFLHYTVYMLRIVIALYTLYQQLIAVQRSLGALPQWI